jgi:hypothetical protein
MNITDYLSDSLESAFWVKNTLILKSGSGIFLTMDPGRKNSNPGSGVNIPDLQH